MRKFDPNAMLYFFLPDPVTERILCSPSFHLFLINTLGVVPCCFRSVVPYLSLIWSFFFTFNGLSCVWTCSDYSNLVVEPLIIFYVEWIDKQRDAKRNCWHPEFDSLILFILGKRTWGQRKAPRRQAVLE